MVTVFSRTATSVLLLRDKIKPGKKQTNKGRARIREESLRPQGRNLSTGRSVCILWLFETTSLAFNFWVGFGLTTALFSAYNYIICFRKITGTL